MSRLRLVDVVFRGQYQCPAASALKRSTQSRTICTQYHANAATNSNGGLKWNAYWKECKKRLKS
jgi:hypothetical protein